MNRFSKVAILTIASLGLLGGTASAEIVCNDDGDCWHVKEKVEYPASVRLRVHSDDWKWTEHDHYRWREHAGRGYWHGGVWVDIK
jgi:hypothetical protein